MEQRPHPEQGYRACLGIMRLAKQYPDARIERACARALHFRALLVQERRGDPAAPARRRAAADETEPPPLPLHGNVRGAKYYH